MIFFLQTLILHQKRATAKVPQLFFDILKMNQSPKPGGFAFLKVFEEHNYGFFFLFFLFN